MNRLVELEIEETIGFVSQWFNPDDLDMWLEEFALPPTVIQLVIHRPPIQANNFELKVVTLQLL